MCQNCTTIQALKVISAETGDGCAVTIAELPGAQLHLENQRNGAMFQPPPCVTLLMLSPGPDTLCFSLDQLMAGFLAALSALAMIDNELGSETLTKWAKSWTEKPTS